MTSPLLLATLSKPPVMKLHFQTPSNPSNPSKRLLVPPFPAAPRVPSNPWSLLRMLSLAILAVMSSQKSPKTWFISISDMTIDQLRSNGGEWPLVIKKVWREPGGCTAWAAGSERESDIHANLYQNTSGMKQSKVFKEKVAIPVYLAEVGTDGSLRLGASSWLFESLSAECATGLVPHFPIHIFGSRLKVFKICVVHVISEQKEAAGMHWISLQSWIRCGQCGQCRKCGSRDQSRIFGRNWQRSGSFAGSLERQWERGKEQQGFLNKYLFLELNGTKVCDLLMFPAFFVSFCFIFLHTIFQLLIFWDILGMVQEDLAISPGGLYESYFLHILFGCKYCQITKKYIWPRMQENFPDHIIIWSSK